MLLRASSATTAVRIGKAAIDDDVATRKPGNLVQPLQDAMWQSAYHGGPVIPGHVPMTSVVPMRTEQENACYDRH
ncbi:MAG: hypothetical protein ACLPKI_05645 [Streptosporangiaceae bacterium]